jgi:hypothetical protein
VDSTAKNFQIALVLATTGAPVYIEEVKLFKAKLLLGVEDFEIKKNVVRVFSKDFDSIAISPFNFRVLGFGNTLNTRMGYKVRMYPAERLYVLDKIPFHVAENKLVSTKTKQYGKLDISFEKIEE